MKFTSPVFSAVSGSIAGVTYSHNKGGMYIRARAVPTNPNTIRQQATRSFLGAAVSAWNEELDANDRMGWQIYAENVPVTNKLGQTVKLSGQQMFIRSYIAAAVAGQIGTITTAPGVFDTGNPVLGVSADGSSPFGIVLASGGGSLQSELAIASPGASGNGTLRIFLGPPVNPGRTYWKGPYQHAVNLPVLDDDTTVQWTTTQTSLLNDNGTLAAAQRRPIRADILYNDGRLSQPFQAVLPVTEASP